MPFSVSPWFETATFSLPPVFLPFIVGRQCLASTNRRWWMPGSLHSFPLEMTGEAWAGLVVGESSLAAGTRTRAWAARCTTAARQDQQSPPGEPDPNGRATEQVHPLSSHRFPGTWGRPSCTTAVICSHLQGPHSSDHLCSPNSFPWLSGLTFSWSLVSGQSPAGRIPLSIPLTTE